MLTTATEQKPALVVSQPSSYARPILSMTLKGFKSK